MTDPEFVREVAQPLSGEANDYDELLKLIGDARIRVVGRSIPRYSRILFRACRDYQTAHRRKEFLGSRD